MSEFIITSTDEVDVETNRNPESSVVRKESIIKKVENLHKEIDSKIKSKMELVTRPKSLYNNQKNHKPSNNSNNSNNKNHTSNNQRTNNNNKRNDNYSNKRNNSQHNNVKHNQSNRKGISQAFAGSNLSLSSNIKFPT